ncbi:MAG: D-alanyl-D-alanine carboxypeptidase [Rhizobiales bacterium]|nr:D-alanyl-D-alanine carboxypeptidase [Hyphomicrobiales bacterium]
MSTAVFKRNHPIRSPFLRLRHAAVAMLMAAGLAAVAATPASANSKYAGIVIDAKTGKVLYENSADAKRYPASLTKMMTLYLTFEALESGRISLSTKVPFSANAAAEPPTKLGVRAGGSITVEQAILSLVTKSANDAATATGEMLGGSEARFAQMMTSKARQLGMNNTTFKNASGLPNSQQVTTARDMARLGIALREHYPQYYKYFSTRSFKFGNSRMGNHNRLLGQVRGVDGIKTGYTRASGFNLVSSVIDRDRSIVAVVLGGRTGASRNAQMQKLIAQYLPKASTRGGGINIAKAGGTEFRVATASFDLPKVGPVPSFNRAGNERIEMAYAASAGDPIVGRAALAAQLNRQKVAVPSPAPAYAPPAPIESAAAAVEAAVVDPITTASTNTSAPEGWQIQIGATPDQGAAQELLGRAKSAAGNPLSGAEPFTMAYNELYRARFGGFSGQKSAVNACRTLKKKGFACWATPN